MFCSAAQWIAANARIVVKEEAADIIMVNVKLCGVADDLVCRPVGDCFAAVGPKHHGSRRCFADTADADHYFAFRVHCGSHSWQKVGWTPWR